MAALESNDFTPKSFQKKRGKNIKCERGEENYTFDIKRNIFVNLHAFPVSGCWCVQEFWPDHSNHGRYSFPAQSGRQLLSVHWMQSALSVTHCLIHTDWLAFSTPGKDRTEKGWPLMSRDQPFFSHNIPVDAHSQCVGVWMLKHRHKVRIERTGNTFGCWKTAHLLSSILCHKWNCLPKKIHTFEQNRYYWDHASLVGRYSIQPQPQSCFISI